MVGNGDSRVGWYWWLRRAKGFITTQLVQHAWTQGINISLPGRKIVAQSQILGHFIERLLLLDI